MNLTAAQETLLRSHPHRTNLYLSIFRPNTLMTARVTGTYDFGDIQINYIDPSSSYLNLYPDITVLIGTLPGQGDVTRLRMRSATGTYVVVAESPVVPQDGQYLTFLDYVTPEAIYPRIIADPNDSENVIFYKDHDIPYSNQNSIYGTFPNAGPHRAGFLVSGTVPFYYTATGTYNVAGSALSYSWNFEGGSPTGSTALTPGNVSYSTPGHYKTRLRVTAANGAVDDTYRYVSVYDRPGVGPNVPILKWELQELSGSRSEGGYSASFKVYENIGQIEPNALVVIFAENWYGGTKTSIGGNAPGNSSIVFVGYILSDTIRFNYKESSVEFQVGSISEAMKQAEGFSVSCESKASPTTWFQLQEMTVPKAMYHYLRWHSTVLKVTDFQYTGDDRLVQYFDSDRGSLYDAVDAFMRDGMLGSIISDRQGKLWAEISSFGLQTPLSTIPTRFTFHKQDWIGSPVIQERRNSDLSFIELGGIAFYGADSNTFSALLTAAPSTVPLYHGKSDRNDGLILTSQAELNQTAGHYLAHHNTRFPDINLSMAGNYNNLDIAPLEKSYLVIDQNDTVIDKSIQDLPYIVDGMEWSYDPRKESWRPDVTLLQIATGTAGQTVLIPAVPPDGGFGYPEIDLPPLPDFGGSSPVGPSIPMQVVFHDTAKGFIYTDNFDASAPNYITINSGLTQTQYQNANFFFMTPNGACYCGHLGQTIGSGGYFVARAPSLGGTWVILYDENNLSDGVNRWGIVGASYNPLLSETVGLVMHDSVGGPYFWLGSGGGVFTRKVLVNTAGYFFKINLSFGLNKWMATTYGSVKLIAADGSSVANAPASVPGGLNPTHVQAGTSGRTFHGRASDGLIVGDNNFATFTEYTDTDIKDLGDDANTFFSCDPVGQFCMSRYGAGLRGKSSDGGATWATMGTLPFSNGYYFKYAGSGGTSVSASRWIAASSIIRFSPDFGSTWMNKESQSLLDIAPIPNINIIHVVGIG